MIFIAHSLRHLLRADAIGFQRLRVEIDIDLALGGAHERDGAYAAHVFQAFLERLIRPIGQLHWAHAFFCAGQHGDRPHRAGRWVKSQNSRLFDLGAQARPHGSHLLAHIIGRFAAIDIERKFHDDNRCAFVTARGEGVDARYGVDGLFNLF